MYNSKTIIHASKQPQVATASKQPQVATASTLTVHSIRSCELLGLNCVHY